MPRIALAVSFLTICAAFTTPSHAAKVKVWRQHQQSHFDKAKFQQAVVSSDGTLRLARQVKLLADLKSQHVWDVVEDPRGNLYVATGDEGKLFKVAPDGKATVAWTASEGHVLSLTVGPDGSVYGGTGPKGQIVRISPEGKASILASDLDSYVWSLVYHPQAKALYAATGPKGRIYQISDDGKSRIFYQTKQEHILCLTLGPKGDLYAGTDKGGLVYRIDPTGKGFVVFHANQNEVRTILATPDAIYAGTSAPTKRPGLPSKGTVSAFLPSLPTLPNDINASQWISFQPDLDLLAQDAKSSSPPSSGDNSIYRIAPDGGVREIFRDKVLVLRMLENKGRLLVATGMSGQLFEIDEKTREKTELVRLDHGQIHALIRRKDGSIVLGAGDPGKLYLLETAYVAQGIVHSDVLDAKLISRWGQLTWNADTPAGTSVVFGVRSGNTAEPDATWSDWGAERIDDHSIKADAPAARYVQYRVKLATQDPSVSPNVTQVVLRYQSVNQAPEITSIDVPDLDAANLDTARKLKVKWTATDANEDDLSYRLYMRKEGWKEWVLLEEDYEKKDFEWDTTAIPSGIYQFKVQASDRKDNAAEDALAAERISVPVPVANTPPAVTLKLLGVEGDRASLEAAAAGTLVRLTEAAYAVNGKRWVNVFPTDGLFDSKNEAFRFKTESLRPGTHVLMVRVRDAAGNIGTADVLFTIAGKK